MAQKQWQMKYKAKVKYWNLGRSKAKGEFEFKGNENNVNTEMLKQFSKHLMSTEISFNDGKIFAGLRNVGNYAAIITPIK